MGCGGLLKLMWETWNDVFGRTLGMPSVSLVQSCATVATSGRIKSRSPSDDADRALDSMAGCSRRSRRRRPTKSSKMKMELRRLIFEEQVRGEKRKAGGSLIESGRDRQRSSLGAKS